MSLLLFYCFKLVWGRIIFLVWDLHHFSNRNLFHDNLLNHFFFFYFLKWKWIVWYILHIFVINIIMQAGFNHFNFFLQFSWYYAVVTFCKIHHHIGCFPFGFVLANCFFQE